MGWRILIIDPEKVYTDFILEQSDELDLSIEFAESVEAASESVAEKPFDVVLLDDAKHDDLLIETIQELKSTKLPPDIFIIGEGLPNKVEQAVKSGASAYITLGKFRTDFVKHLKKLKKSNGSVSVINKQLIELHHRLTDDRPKILVVDDSFIHRKGLFLLFGFPTGRRKYD